MKKFLVMALLVMIVATSSSLSAAGSDPRFMVVGTAAAGGAFYPIGIAIADVITNKVGIQTTAQVTGGAIENNPLVSNRTVDLAITMGFMAYNASKGLDPYKQPQKDLSLLFSGLSKGVFHIVVNKNSSIHSIKDLKGKKVALGPAGGGAIAVANDVFGYYGIKPQDYKPIYNSYEQAADALVDGNLDAIVVQSAAPASAIIQLTAAKKPVRFLTIDQDVMDKMLKKLTYYSKVVLPKSMYDTDSAITTIYTPLVVIVNKKLSADLTYRMTKAIFENVEVIKKSHPSASELSIESAVEGLAVPLHPGARKYFKEKGLLK